MSTRISSKSPTQRKVLSVALIANHLLMDMQKGLKRSWSFFGLATMVMTKLMHYADFRSLFNNPEKDRGKTLAKVSVRPPSTTTF